MKQVLLLLSVCLLAITSCKKEDSIYKYSGVIEGVDNTKCSCCGGYIISVDDIDSSYRAFSLPPGNTISASSHFPIYINLNFSGSERCGNNNIINISQLIIKY